MTCSNSTLNNTRSVRDFPAPGSGRIELMTAQSGLRVSSVLDLGDAIEMGYGEAGDALDTARDVVAAGILQAWLEGST